MNEKALVTLLAAVLATRSMMLHRQFMSLPRDYRDGIVDRLARFVAGGPDLNDRSARSLRSAALEYLQAAQTETFDFWSLLSIPNNHLVAAFLEREYARMAGIPEPVATPFRVRSQRPTRQASAEDADKVQIE